MAIATISEGITLDTIVPVCGVCFAGPLHVEGVNLCADCLDVACAWEVFEDRHGYKPRGWSDADLVAWLRRLED